MSTSESTPSLAEFQRQAHEFLKGQRWSAARQLLQEAVRHYSSSADLFSDLAAAERSLGDLGRAIHYYQEALRLDPKLAFVHKNLGNALQDRGEVREAIDCYHRALVLQPRFPAALNDLASALLRIGRLGDAQKAIERLFTITRDFLPAYETLADLCEKQGNLQEALKHFSSLAQHYLKTGEPQKALKAMDACQRLGLRSAALETNRCAALLQLGRPDEAKTAAQLALQLDPGHANAHVNLASAHVALSDYHAAIPCLKRAVELAPNLAPAFINLGNAYAELGEYAEARAAQERALAISPDAPQALVGLALALQVEGRRNEAIELYRRALSVVPHYAEAHSRLGVQLLSRGELREGFREYEWRRLEQPLAGLLARYPGVPYAGQGLAGKTLLLYAEQSYAEAIQFLRYAEPLKAQGARIVVDCAPQLQRLFGAQPYVDATIDWNEQQVPCDFFAPLLSLPHLADTTLETIPNRPYLQVPAGAKVPPELVTDKRKVGLVWTATPRYRADRSRSLNLGLLSSLGQVEGIRWFSLQLGPGREQIAAVPDLQVVDLAPHLADFADTAAVVSQLDLLITVDADVAHLAGALGVPTWVLLPHLADWRWMADKNDSPWYPTARLFRQPKVGDWVTVAAEVDAAVRLWARPGGANQTDGRQVLGG
jgi:tetratricopeptide (TPR) repeat protein